MIVSIFWLGMKYPVFPNVDTSGITQQHGSLPGDTFQTVGLRLLTPGVSNEVPAFHSAQQGKICSFIFKSWDN